MAKSVSYAIYHTPTLYRTPTLYTLLFKYIIKCIKHGKQNSKFQNFPIFFSKFQNFPKFHKIKKFQIPQKFQIFINFQNQKKYLNIQKNSKFS